MSVILNPAVPEPNAVPIAPFDPVVDPNTPPSTQVREGFVEPLPSQTALLSGKWTDRQAAYIVRTDFDRASAYRQTNHESRWQEAAELYLAYNRDWKVWEGTRIPRANMQIHLCFQQVEALIPQIVDALTGNDLDFDVESGSATSTVQQNHAVRRLIQYTLRSLGGSNTRFLNWREVIRRQVKEGLIFGNGICEFGWEGPFDTTFDKLERVNFPEYTSAFHPILNANIQIPTGRTLQSVQKVTKRRTISQFWIDPCSLMDFYIDPECRGVNVQEATFGIRRKMMTVEELDQMRGQVGFTIPPIAELFRLAQLKQWTQGDTTRQAIASAHGENYFSEGSSDPRLAKVEVLRYFSRDHHVWLLGRIHVAFNGENQYGCIPFTNWAYVDVPDAFYAQSIPDLCRTDQKLAKALIDGRLDELNLLLHPPTFARAGVFRTATQNRLSPGRVIEINGDPLKDLQRMEMGNVTQGAFIEVDSLENRVQKKTGVTDLAVLGTPSSGGNSANRTATGVQAQTNASNSRVHYLVANWEDQTGEPLLNVIWQLSREYLTMEQVQNILGADAALVNLDPIDLYNVDPRFVMKTAQRMKQRAGLQGGGINTLMQYALNPEIGTLMEEQQNLVLDVANLSELYCDTFNVRASQLFRPMTPQEMQASQARKAAPDQAKMALQTARLQSMSADAHQRDETELIKTIITAMATAGLLNKVVGIETPAELASRQLDAEISGGQYDAEPAAASAA